MDKSRCPKCKKRLIKMTNRTDRTSLLCLKCDNVDPMKTDAVSGPTADLPIRRVEPRKEGVLGKLPLVWNRRNARGLALLARQSHSY